MNSDIRNSIKFIDSPQDFLKDFPQENTMLFIDENVHRHFEKEFAHFKYEIIPSGESQKRFEVVELLLGKLLEAGIDRKGTLIGIGGGVVSDLTGFVGSIYLRGINFGFLPTTLLSMCDASIGGKNGINFGAAKNMVGTFNQPDFIAVYPEFLRTLEQREFVGGMAEVIKHAVIHGGELHQLITENSEGILQKNGEQITKLLQLAMHVKVNVVEQDERESGLRKKLNLGHTVGHAIEATSDFSHGECVSIGMNLAAKISAKMGLATEGLVEEIEQLCKAYQLPISCGFDPTELIQKIGFDKKRISQSVDFIMPISFGDVRIMPLEISNPNTIGLEEHLIALSHE